MKIPVTSTSVRIVSTLISWIDRVILTSAMNSTRNKSKDIFVYEMPAKERFELCKILDVNNTWEVLAEHMNYSQGDIEVSQVRKIFQTHR